MRLATLALWFAAASPAQTYVVDAAMGPGANFPDIASAVAGVPDGVSIEVRAGSYGNFTIDDKSLVISGLPGARVVATILNVVVRNIQVAKSVTLRNLAFGSTGAPGAVKIQGCWAAFVRSVAAKERSVPRFCQREIEAFLRCGVPAHGVARVHCDGCGADDVVAFSCKGRGICPSCGAARMVDTAAWLCDAVLSEVPVRQWVLSLPYRVRALCAYDAAACALVRSVLVRAVSGFYERAAGRVGVPRPRTGAVAFVQRFDSALRLNVHFHVLWLDGAYGWVPGQGQPVFHAQPEVTDADVQLLVQRIHARVLRALRKAGKWVDEDAAADADCAPADDLLPGLAAAAVAGRAAFGERAGRRDGRVGGDGRWRPQAKGPLCAALDGFSLHANTWVAPRDRERLEALCRYAARPAVSESRLAELPDGRIGYALKALRRRHDGGSDDERGLDGAPVRAGAAAAQAPGDLPRRVGAGVRSAAEGGAAADGGG